MKFSSSAFVPGLGGKLSLYAALLILLTTCSLALSLALDQFDHERQSFHSLGLGLAHATAEQAEMGVFSGDVSELERVVRNAARLPGVGGVSVLDHAGRVLAHHGAALPPAGAMAQARARAPVQAEALGDAGSYLAHETHVAFVAPVLSRPGPAMPGESHAEASAALGQVLISLDTGLLYGRLQRLVEAALRTVVVLGVLGTAGMAWLARRAVRPLREVTQAARILAGGNLDHRLDTHAADEAGELAQAFNQMTAQLREARDTLERRVAERTRQLEQATAEACRLARHDALTGLPNRVSLREQLESGIDAMRRQGRSVAVLFVDVDHFKAVNDSLGHESGDLVLQAIAQRLTALVADHGFVARLGGDEFVVVMTGLPRGQDHGLAASLAQEVIAVISHPIALPGQEVRMGASVGVALCPGDAREATTLLRAADTAMYAAKNGGRMGFRLFDAEMEAPARERLQVETDLRRALLNAEFELWYQPQWSIDGQALVGAEALLRWRHPQRGLVSPALFIPVAESSGLIRDIGAWVLAQAVRDARAWNADARQPLRVAVNISACQLNRSDIVETVAGALATHGLAPGLLELELTESGIVEDPEHGLQVLLRLQALGVQLSIDDFGTGFSSLSHLTRLPVNALKIDRSFIAGLPDARNDLAVVQAICAMARKLQLQVVAEGVETTAQLQLLQGLGCDMAQGYLLGKPMPRADLERLLAERRAAATHPLLSAGA